MYLWFIRAYNCIKSSKHVTKASIFDGFLNAHKIVFTTSLRFWQKEVSTPPQKNTKKTKSCEMCTKRNPLKSHKI